MEKISITCSGCGAVLRAGKTLIGKRVPCPQCKTAIVITLPPETPKNPGEDGGPSDHLDNLSAIGDYEYSSTPSHSGDADSLPFEKSTTREQRSSTSPSWRPARGGGIDRGNKVERIDFSNTLTNLGDRYYFTSWFENAKGLANRYLEALDSCLLAAEFPEAYLTRATVTNGSPQGCLAFASAKRWEFDAVAFWSKKPDLDHSRCIYKATEFGNVLHVSLLFYSHFDPGCNHAGKKLLSGLNKLLGAANAGVTVDLEEAEYSEAFQRFIFMAMEEAFTHLGVNPIKQQQDERRKKDFTSTIKGLVGGS